jgi:hypothetical protein
MKNKKLTHRREYDLLGPWSAELPKAIEAEDLIAFAMTFYGVGKAHALRLVSPLRIIADAGAWDDIEFVDAWWKVLTSTRPALDQAGYKTCDGAVVINPNAVVITYGWL